jgi:hypothetical protein
MAAVGFSGPTHARDQVGGRVMTLSDMFADDALVGSTSRQKDEVLTRVARAADLETGLVPDHELRRFCAAAAVPTTPKSSTGFSSSTRSWSRPSSRRLCPILLVRDAQRLC